MIGEATDFVERVRAVDFILRIARPDLSADDRQRVAVIHGLQPAGVWHAIDRTDVDPGAALTRRLGHANSPIFTVHRDGELIGAVACSCVIGICRFG
ncbi:hypothetical protein [Mesorhizobium sp. M0678]|uniref:hypothetical protein n=1 Tax=Mesorhizobium sp. M0678 TaxID=2956985 RepID=UPI003339CFBD